MTPEIGDVVAGHRLLERIGENGGSGCLLFRAQDIGLNRTVAFKLLPKHFTENEGFRRRFEREAELAARINEHQNVVSIYQFGEVAGQLFLTMQYINGRDLAQVIKTEGPLDVARTCVILEQVADALDTAHAAGLVHRDVKPGNIFVSSAHGPLAGPVTAYIGDFGLALPIGDPAKTTSLYYGTPGYVAPERRIGASPTPLVDVYGLGCVAYACLTGSPPFDAHSDVAHPAPPVLTTRYPHLPAAVDEVLARAIAWQPEHRYSRCREFIAALRTAGGTIHHEVTKPPPLTPPAGLMPEPAAVPLLPARRRTRLWLAAAVAGAIAITASAVLVASSGNTTAGRPTSIEPGSPNIAERPVGAELSAMALDGKGNLYLADRDDHRVRKLTPAGVLTTVAGGNRAGFAGDDGPATEARLDAPEGLALDDAGNLYIADTKNGRVRKVAPNQVITTVAKDLESPVDVAIDPAGGFFVAESGGHQVRRVDEHGQLTVVAGTGTDGFSGDGGPASTAQLSAPSGLAVHAGNLYIADSGNSRVRRVDGQGVIATVAGSDADNTDENVADGVPATEAALSSPDAIAVDAGGTLYVAEKNGQRIRRVATSGAITTITGTGDAGFDGDGGKATAATLAFPEALLVTGDGSIYVADTRNQRVRYIDRTGTITTIAGAGRKYPADNAPAARAYLWNPEKTEAGPDGSFYIADRDNDRVRKVNRDGTITTVAGNGARGDSGDGGPATSARLNEPMGLALDEAGNIYIANRGSDRVRKVAKDGTITTVAGVGRFGHSADGGQADESELASPADVAVDPKGNLYFVELDGHRVRRVDPAGVITTVAGNGTEGFAGDGGPATQAMLAAPNGIDVAADGTLYIADRKNLRVRKVAPGGTITTFAGTGDEGNAGDGGPAIDGQLEWPNAVSVDVEGNVYIGDGHGNRVRKVDTRGEISTVLGTGTEGVPENGKKATDTNVYAPSGVDVDEAGRLYVTDVDNDQVYLVDLDGRVRIVAGIGW